MFTIKYVYKMRLNLQASVLKSISIKKHQWPTGKLAVCEPLPHQSWQPVLSQT